MTPQVALAKESAGMGSEEPSAGRLDESQIAKKREARLNMMGKEA
jgi:hypothetical protein